MSKSAFDAWFTSQYGRRPDKNPPWVLKDRIETAEAEVTRARGVLDSVLRWEDARHAALLAWQARGEGK